MAGTSASRDDDLEELRLLARAAGAVTVDEVLGRWRTPDARTFIGSGKLEELASVVRAHEAGLVLFNHTLTPSQERNLEKALDVRVVDRTGLILDIFAQRARSFEGKLQVELAQLRHLSTRLVRGWTHLERQKGGIGLRGPGETQLETDKRLLANRIRQIQKRLEKVAQQRHQGRQARKRAELPVVGLVGYTNAGKSTLFNALTEAGVFAADQLFATLDPTVRRLRVGSLDLVLADTVGFVRDLPHELVAAFQSTLQEACEADLILHVVDASDPDIDERLRAVTEVLETIGAVDVPQLLVYNKIDLMEGAAVRTDRDAAGQAERLWMSAATGAGLDELRLLLEERLSGRRSLYHVQLGPAEGQLHARLFREGRIVSEVILEEGGWQMTLDLPDREAIRLGWLAPPDPDAEPVA